MSEYRTDEAFGPVPLWLTESKVSDRAVRLYALLSGLRDYGTNMTSMGRKLLASKLHCSDDSLDRAKAELEKVGAISVERYRAGDGSIARNLYTIHRVRPGTRTRAEGSRTRADEALRVPASVRDGVLIGDESSSSSKEPQVVDASHVKVKSSRGEGWYTVDVAARDGKGECGCKGFQVRKWCRHIDEARAALGLPEAKGREPVTVGGKRVTPAEHDAVDALLARFNELAGTRYAGKQYRTTIVRRCREHPELTLDSHLTLLARQFEEPWWKGDPTPSVIWSEKVFDRVLNGARGGKAKAEHDFSDYRIMTDAEREEERARFAEEDARDRAEHPEEYEALERKLAAAMGEPWPPAS